MRPQISLLQAAQNLQNQFGKDNIARVFKKPVFIVSAPRSGSTLLFEQLQKTPGLWSIGSESHAVFGQFPHLQAENRQLDSGCLNASHADNDTSALIKACFPLMLKNSKGEPYLGPHPEFKPITFLEKTPRNALNIPFLLHLFPDAKFIYLYRDPRENIASIIEAWKMGLKSGQFITFRNLPQWHLQAWCLLLPPGWQQLRGKSLDEIACFQWCQSNQIILDNLSKLEHQRYYKISYNNLIDNPVYHLKKLAEFTGHPSHDSSLFTNTLPLSKTTLTTPHPDKWKKYQNEILNLKPQWSEIWKNFKPILN